MYKCLLHPFQELEKVQQEAEDLRAHLVQQGTTLLSRNKQSLAAELESASTEEVQTKCTCTMYMCVACNVMCTHA